INRWQDRMNTYLFAHARVHFLGDSATHPIEPPWRALAALLLLAGISLLPRRALPAHPMAAHSGASNCGF
ncbi:hypothetical protein, partial [Polaromonas sp.]|uniref:hypothetical protein n=1 Tax=Polaromonas sp. TaxID=1869339 RepID=UPI002FC6D3F2